MPIYQKPGTSRPAKGHCLYLLRKQAVTRPDQVWAMDMTHMPMVRGFVCLVAVPDWFSRKVPAWRLSTTLETEPCIEALKEAMRCHGKPEIMNTDQSRLYRCRKDATNPTAAIPAARTTGAAGSLEKGFRAAREFIWGSLDVSLEYLVALDEARFVELMRRRGSRVDRGLP